MISFFKGKVYGNSDPIIDEQIDSEDDATDIDIEDSLKQFREALKDDNNNKMISMEDDDTLLRFLRVKSFNIGRAVELACRCEEVKSKYAEMLSMPFYECCSSLETGHLIVLKQKDLYGRRVIIFRSKLWNPEKNPMDMVCRLLLYVVDELLKSPETQFNGIVVVFDNSEVSFTRLAHLISYFTYGETTRIVSFFQGGFAVKLKGFHLIPAPYIAASAYQAFKYLLKKKMRRRVHIHGEDFSGFYRLIGKENVPDFLGGDVKYEDCIDKEFMKNIYAADCTRL